MNNRYVLIQKLGWGHFSTVWLAKDFKYSTYVAVKVMKSSPHYLEASYDEVFLVLFRFKYFRKWLKMLWTKNGWNHWKIMNHLRRNMIEMTLMCWIYWMLFCIRVHMAIISAWFLRFWESIYGKYLKNMIARDYQSMWSSKLPDSAWWV